MWAIISNGYYITRFQTLAREPRQRDALFRISPQVYAEMTTDRTLEEYTTSESAVDKALQVGWFAVTESPSYSNADISNVMDQARGFIASASDRTEDPPKSSQPTEQTSSSPTSIQREAANHCRTDYCKRFRLRARLARSRLRTIDIGWSVRWSQHVDADSGGRTFTEPAAVLDETLYLGSQSGNTGVVALDATTGEAQWKKSTQAVTGGPVAHPKGVVVQSHQLVTAFNTDGTRQWSFNVVDGRVRPIAVDDRHVYVSAGNTLYVIDWSGEESWKYEPTKKQVGTPTSAGNTVLIPSEEQLIAVSRETGEEQWTTSPEGAGRPIVTPEAIFLPGSNGTVIALGET